MVSFLSVLYRVDEFLKGNIMTRSVFAELLKHNPYELVQLSVQRRPPYPDNVLDRPGLETGHAILA